MLALPVDMMDKLEHALAMGKVAAASSYPPTASSSSSSSARSAGGGASDDGAATSDEVATVFAVFYSHLNGTARCFDIFDACDTTLWEVLH